MLTFNFSPFPQLETERLLLKQLTDADAPALFEMRSKPEVMQYIDRPLAKTVEDTQALIKVISDAVNANDGITWGLFPKTSPQKVMGTIGFWRAQKEHHRAEIGYLIHPSLQGKGFMGEALKVVLKYGFGQMRLHSVEAQVKPGNAASLRLLERCGFVREAYFKENFYFNGRFGDTVVYSLLTPLTNSETAKENQ